MKQPGVVHFKKEPFDVYIGRPSKWGNPFTHKPSDVAQTVVASREEAIKRYESWIFTQPHLMMALPELRGKVLGCWCHPKPCHGDVLMRLANMTAEDLNKKAWELAELLAMYPEEAKKMAPCVWDHLCIHDNRSPKDEAEI